MRFMDNITMLGEKPSWHWQHGLPHFELMQAAWDVLSRLRAFGSTFIRYLPSLATLTLA